jgi:hypothetical protein
MSVIEMGSCSIDKICSTFSGVHMKYFSVDFESVDSRLLFSIRLIDLILAITYIEKLLCKLILKHDLSGLRQ